MADEFFCRLCKTVLTGALELCESIVGKHAYMVFQDTSDCNWRRCKGCKNILCKKCDDAERLYCCDEGRIVSRERAAAALIEGKREVAHEVSRGS